ncbi:hypothetical protein LTR65_000393 [Meristemomyces frigidus]
MSSTQTSPSSSLLRLPVELRDEIYELAVIAESQDREVDVFSRCKPRSVLNLVSKQLDAEVKQVVARKKLPCRHTLFSFTLEKVFGGRGGMRRQKHHDMNDASQLRIVAINSGNNNPLAVIVTFPAAPETPLLNVYGASQERQAELEARFVDDMGSLRTRQRDLTKHRMIEKVVILLRIALHRVW